MATEVENKNGDMVKVFGSTEGKPHGHIHTHKYYDTENSVWVNEEHIHLHEHEERFDAAHDHNNVNYISNSDFENVLHPHKPIETDPATVIIPTNRHNELYYRCAA